MSRVESKCSLVSSLIGAQVSRELEQGLNGMVLRRALYKDQD